MKLSFTGSVAADIVEARFAFSGKVVYVQKTSGDQVAPGEVIASLDRKILQTELDRQLADYERVRAEFDLFTSKTQESEPFYKFLLAGKQAQLNASVKEVELAKFRLDQSSLISPVAGVISDSAGLRVGQYITPGSSPIKIIDLNSFKFEFEVPQDHVDELQKGLKGKIKIAFGKNQIDQYDVETSPRVIGSHGKFLVFARLPQKENLVIGLEGDITLQV